LILYFGFSFGLSVLLGSLWSIVNLYAIKLVFTALLKKENKNIKIGLLVLFFKIPVLYVAGYFLVTWTFLSIPGLLWGFSGIFLVSLLKALSRSYLKYNKIANPKETKA
jgi:hypothetical protein